jgi:hypothetical protein
MKTHWNDQIALENPHKGWYHHYPDNHINKYIIREDSHLLDFPGMDHVYIRLSWAYLEPEEGKFSWDIIDDIINKWTEKGLKISFRISCKETSTDRIEQQFATPKWVMEAGAKGDYYDHGEKVGPDGPWEPVFDDPVWENRGVAPAYHPYVLKVRLVGSKTVDFEIESGNRKWMPVATDEVHREKYMVAIPEGIPPGQYDLKLKLYSYDEKKDVFLALDPDLLDEENYYKIAVVQVKKKKMR